MFSLGGHLASDNGFQTINLTSGYNFLTSNFMPRLVWFLTPVIQEEPRGMVL